jgi:2-oxoglutarate ferredoxin oxidoreductase subunit alpha
MPLEYVNVHLTPGRHFLQGDEACAEGAVAAGCRFFAGYPITPASEIMEVIVKRFDELNRAFIQMEDEIGSMGAIVGASWPAPNSMTATSGPGDVIKNGKPGLRYYHGNPLRGCRCPAAWTFNRPGTRTAQGVLMQARWGTHGDHTIIALFPGVVQEAFSETIRAFNLAEKYRTPVIVLMEEATGHLREIVEIPEKK